MNKRASTSSREKLNLRKRIHHFVEDTKIVLSVVYAFIIMFFFLFLLLEFKRYYAIDLIPGYDSPIDDLYGAMKGIISEFLKRLFGEDIRFSAR